MIPFVEFQNVSKIYTMGEVRINALHDASFTIEKGETYGLVGESGQGKTVLALTIQQLLQCPPGIVERGEILLDGEDLLKKSQKQMQREVRGKKVAMIFQDPMSCLNPVFTVGTIMMDVLKSPGRGATAPGDRR